MLSFCYTYATLFKYVNHKSGLSKYHARLRLGPISFRTSWKFIFTCPWTRTNVLSLYNSVFHILINYYELTSCIDNSVNPDQLASEEASWSGSTLFTREASWSGSIPFTRVDTWFHTVFERVNCLSTEMYKLICSFGQVKFSMDKYIISICLSLDK